jgi:hypothetical protein
VCVCVCVCVCVRVGGGGEFVVLSLRYETLLSKSASLSMHKVDTIKCRFHTSHDVNASTLHFSECE